MVTIDNLERRIRNLSVQGATNVALTTLTGIAEAAKEATGENAYTLLKNTATRLAYARPTEPLAQNAVRFIFDKPGGTPDYYIQRADNYRNLIFDTKSELVKQAAAVIENGGVYLTHCHSSAVVSCFKEARKHGKIFSVIATETRPLYQGRMTVRELLGAGFEDVTLIVDDAAPAIIAGRLKTVTGVFIGADFICRSGFVNKIGSLGIIQSAQAAGIPNYSLCSLLKYSPLPFSHDIIEIRQGTEVWRDAPPKLNYFNPAFDFIPFRFDTRIITEAGIMDKDGIEKTIHTLYTFIKE